jgi:hypothetical protein
MFTLLVSWLLVAGVPLLLMLAALALARLEKELAHEASMPVEVAEILQRADAVEMHTLTRASMPEALEYLHQRQPQWMPDPGLAALNVRPRHALPSFVPDRSEHTLPTRIQAHPHINPQFRATRHVNRV